MIGPVAGCAVGGAGLGGPGGQVDDLLIAEVGGFDAAGFVLVIMPKSGVIHAGNLEVVLAQERFDTWRVRGPEPLVDGQRLA